MKLFLNASIKLALGIVLVGALLFLPARTIYFPNAWLFICLLFVPMTIMGIVLFIKAPRLLKKRLNSKEKQKTQKGVKTVLGLMFLVGFILCAIDFRFEWSNVPLWLIIASSILFELGYLMYAEVLRENAYLSRTVEVEQNQKVVSNGLYGMVRHPMYLATILLFLSIPLILGSWWSLVVFLFYPVFIVIRIQNEEKVLSEQLDGYWEYKKKVKYKLIPFVW